MSRFFGMAIVILASPFARADRSVLRGYPTHFLTCESMLDGRVARHATGANALPIVRDAMFEIRKATDFKEDPGVSFARFRYSGRKCGMKGRAARVALGRLAGIEAGLTETNLDSQIVTFEFRGAQIAEALTELEAVHAEIKHDYADLSRGDWPLTGRAGNVLIHVFFGALAYGFVTDVSQLVLDPLGASWLDTLKNLALDSFSAWFFFKPIFEMDRERFDADFGRLLRTLRKMSASTNHERVFVSSQNTTLPTEFSRMLLASRVTNAERAVTRTNTHRAFGRNPLAVKFEETVGLAQGYLAERRGEVLSAGDVDRIVLTDHVVFFDEEAREWVWLFSFRTFRQEPTGRPPRNPREENRSRESTPLPGWLPTPSAG